MRKDDIIRMAREAGFNHPRLETETDYSRLERFADLVAAHIRETEFKPDWNNYRQGFKDGAAEEREACAKVCDTHTVDDVLVGVGIAQSCAAVIRARGQA